MGLGLHRANAREQALLLRGQLDSYLIGNRFGHFVLQRQNVAQVALLGLSPDVRVGGSVDQLRGDGHSVRRENNG